MSAITRRQFLRASGTGIGLGLLGGLGAVGCASTMWGDIAPKVGPRVVVIGGGWSGATAAKYVRLEDPGIEVVMLEPNREFISCPFSNLVLSGLRTMQSITHKYDGLARHGVKIIHDSASTIEADKRRVRVGDGYLEYDRLIVSPGVDFQWDQVEGLAQNQDKVLHAWKAGPQTAEHDKRNQGEPALKAAKALMLTIPDETLTELAAYYSSLR